ncbi:MAG: hypothetical protein KDM91_16520, partial [Verrucomicrobiae bacterium]|nr:hypothetical protein [Verrucomicrobiae bacterium]
MLLFTPKSGRRLELLWAASVELYCSLKKMDPEIQFPTRPYAPIGAKALPNVESLYEVRNLLNEPQWQDQELAVRIQRLLSDWTNDPTSVEPYTRMQSLLEEIRCIPVSKERVRSMNTVVKTLGEPTALATFLDMLRDSTTRDGTEEQFASKAKLQNVKMHSLYGWCGNTLLVESLDAPTVGTHEGTPGLADRLGNPSASWNLTIHVWQPTSRAKGFPIVTIPEGKRLEPPHSHPFDFASMIVKGCLHQSIYSQTQEGDPTPQIGHYGSLTFEHVDGVWPPHSFHGTCRLATREHSVELREGDSYYMPCDWIHDVEVDGEIARTKPAISLFLSSEYLVMP